MKASIYARVSTEDQARKDKISIQEQVQKCKEAIFKKGWDLVETYIDAGISGRKIENRKAVLKLLEDTKNKKFNLVVVHDFDRLSRSRASAVLIREELKDNFIQTYSINQPVEPQDPETYNPDDDDPALIVEAFSDTKAELDVRRIVRNYKMGMKNRVVNRGKMVSHPPYGYKTKMVKRNGKFEKIYVIDKKKAKIVKRIYNEYYYKDYGIWKIGKRLNREGIPSPQNKLWHRSTIINILGNPVYCGKTRWGWKICRRGKRIYMPPEKWIVADGEHEAIISQKLFEKVQKRKAEKKTMGGGVSISPALLIGIAKCGYCGYSMFSDTDKRRNHFFYKCGTYAHTGMCRPNLIRQEVVDKFVIEDVAKLANMKAKKAMMEQRAKEKLTDVKKDSEQKKKALENIKERLKRLLTAYEKGFITLEEFGQEKIGLKEEEKELKEEYLELQRRLEKAGMRVDVHKEFKQALGLFKRYNNEAKNGGNKRILQALIERVEIKKRSIKIFYRLD